MSSWREVKVLPWVGERYAKPSLFPYRTLILGESNYTDAALYTPQLVIECVKDHLTGNEDPNFSRFATKIRRLALGERGDLTAGAFWSEVAFYNFVQARVGEAARDRPTEAMWRESVPAFQEVVANLQPQRLWVLGKANWLNLLQQLPHRRLDPFTVSLEAGSEPQPLLASYTNHPSSSLLYSVWAPVARQLLFGDAAVADPLAQ